MKQVTVTYTKKQKNLRFGCACGALKKDFFKKKEKEIISLWRFKKGFFLKKEKRKYKPAARCLGAFKKDIFKKKEKRKYEPAARFKKDF